MLGWYLLLLVMLAVIDFPILVPVSDLSTVIKAGSERQMKNERKDV